MKNRPFVENEANGPAGEKRDFSDRRKESTPMFSRYTLQGRRSGFRRKEEQAKGGYVDRYSSGLLLILVILLTLNIIDVFFTMFILDCGGKEINPFIKALIDRCGDQFWIWKFLLVAFGVLFLCLHIHFPRVKKAIWAVTLIYGAVILYQAYIILFQIPLGR